MRRILRRGVRFQRVPPEAAHARYTICFADSISHIVRKTRFPDRFHMTNARRLKLPLFFGLIQE
jgi:hypothetical protein